MNKTDQRVQWIVENIDAIKASFTPISGSTHNARYTAGMSGGGFGWWAKAFEKAGFPGVACRMYYWSGSNPTPSTAINLGVALFICDHAPADLR